METEEELQQQLVEAKLSEKASKTSSSNVPNPHSVEYKQSPFYEILLGILGVGDITVLAAAYMKFDKLELTSIHNKACMYLAHPQIGKIFGMSNKSEKEYQGTREATKAADELVPVSLKDLKIGKRNEGVVLYGQLCVEPFNFFRIYTLLEEVGSECTVSLSIVSADPLSIDQSFARKNYPEGLKIAVKEPIIVKGEGGLIFINVDNPLSIEVVQSLPAFVGVYDDGLASEPRSEMNL